MKKLLLLIFLFIAGCGPWQMVGGPYKGDTFTADLPAGWMRSRTTDYLLITHDGVLLQYVALFQNDVDAQFKFTKKKLRRGMMPQEAAEVILDNISSNQEVQNLEIKENKPSRLAGEPAFRTVFTYRNSDGLKYKSIYYGFVKGDKFYGIRYSAPSRYYFDHDVKTFENIVKSVRLL